jgi:hypothetical protein
MFDVMGLAFLLAVFLVCGTDIVFSVVFVVHPRAAIRTESQPCKQRLFPAPAKDFFYLFADLLLHFLKLFPRNDSGVGVRNDNPFILFVL